MMLRRRLVLLEWGGGPESKEDGWKFCLDDYLTTPGRSEYPPFPPLLQQYLDSRPNMLQEIERLINGDKPPVTKVSETSDEPVLLPFDLASESTLQTGTT